MSLRPLTDTNHGPKYGSDARLVVSLPVCALVCLLLHGAGCTQQVTPSMDLSGEALARSEEYKKHQSYESLKWLESNALREGMKKEAVVEVFGPPLDPYDGDPERVWMYQSQRDIPEGHLLIIHFSGADVEGWEWASE